MQIIKSVFFGKRARTINLSYKCGMLLVVSLYLFFAIFKGVAIAADDCRSTDQLSQVRCTAHQVKLLKHDLNSHYQKTIGMFPEKHDTDIQKEREQLRRSQDAWLLFVTENCSLIGGLNGGNNLSVTHHSLLCEEKEIESRIKFLINIKNSNGY